MGNVEQAPVKTWKNLTVEVGLLNGVHVRDMYDPRLAAPHPHHRPILQHLAPVQGYLAHEKRRPPKDPSVGLCLGPYGGPREEGSFL